MSYSVIYGRHSRGGFDVSIMQIIEENLASGVRATDVSQRAVKLACFTRIVNNVLRNHTIS